MKEIIQKITETEAISEEFKLALDPTPQKEILVRQKALESLLFWANQAIDYLDKEIQAICSAQYIDHPAGIMSGLKNSIKEIE